MHEVCDFLFKHRDEIIVGIIATAICSFFAIIFRKIINIKKRLLSRSMPEPKEEAIYLNTPRNLLDDSCVGRDELLEKVINKITDGKKSLFIKKCVFITGEEGIGKTLFCYILFRDYLPKYPVYLGWIECNGKQSIFDIISITFEDLRFRRKDKEDIIKGFAGLNRPCILFVDQINQYTSLDELKDLSRCTNVILILSGLLRKINFVNNTFILPPLSKKNMKTLFEQRAKEDIEKLMIIEKKSVSNLLDFYAKGNPFLIIAFANAKRHYENSWENVLKNMQTREYEDDDYLKNILRQVYKINKLNNVQRMALSKLCSFQYDTFTKSVFELLDISDDCITSLCNTYWLNQKDSIVYSMDIVHCNAIAKLFMFELNIKNAIVSINDYLSEKIGNTDNGFRWISVYIEDLLKRIRGYEAHIMEEGLFFEFTYYVAWNYWNINNNEKCLEWIELCKTKNAELLYKKACIEFQTKYRLINTLYSSSEIEEAYFNALEKAKATNDFANKKRFLMQEYCNYLIFNAKYDDAISLSKKYFDVYNNDLSDANNCIMFFRYLCVANRLDDIEALKWLVNEKSIQALYQNDKVSIAVAWSFGELGNIFKKKGDKESSDTYMKHMVVLLNKQAGFYDSVIKTYMRISEEEFAEYMHSCDELLDSLNDALIRKDAEALYIEGRYQEKCGNYDGAFALYEEAATRDSLRGMCSLALLYYRGQGEPRDYDKARRYWVYCCERGHRGSFYWLGILLLDTDYDGYNKELAIQNLTKAAELGSERAKQKLLAM